MTAWSAALGPLHGLLPMWVEGMPAYLDQLLGILGRACTPPVNAIELWGRTVPLAIDGYQGPLMTYLDVPAARAWLGALTDDPYMYRYKGSVLLAVSGFLLSLLLCRVVPPAIAASATMGRVHAGLILRPKWRPPTSHREPSQAPRTAGSTHASASIRSSGPAFASRRLSERTCRNRRPPDWP